MSTLSITILQTNLFWEDKGANLDLLTKKIGSIEAYTEVIVLPEMFSTGFSMQPEKFAENMDGPTVDWMRRMAVEKKAIITGSLIMVPWVIMIKGICLLLREKISIIAQAIKD